MHYLEGTYCTVLPAPRNVQIRRASSTAMEVTWDAPVFPGINGYRVFYNMFSDPDMDKWLSVEIHGPYTVTEISGLEPHTVYCVRVRAKSLDGRYGEFSETIVANKIEHGKDDVSF